MITVCWAALNLHATIYLILPANICALLDACALPIDAISRGGRTLVIYVLFCFARFTGQPRYIGGLNGMAVRACVPEVGSYLALTGL